MLEIQLIIENLQRMIRGPRKFFRDISKQEVNLIIPIILLLITGILLGVMVYRQIPELQKQWAKLGTEMAFDIKYRISQKKTEALFFPVWVVLFWFLFTVVYTYIISWLGGSGEFKRIFNCTSYLAYPYLLITLINFHFFNATEN